MKTSEVLKVFQQYRPELTKGDIIRAGKWGALKDYARYNANEGGRGYWEYDSERIIPALASQIGHKEGGA